MKSIQSIDSNDIKTMIYYIITIIKILVQIYLALLSRQQILMKHYCLRKIKNQAIHYKLQIIQYIPKKEGKQSFLQSITKKSDQKFKLGSIMKTKCDRI
ncbi:unnamed protein product [Paramecium sonneborni]|uniref:Transmembrane protein n=1 Tax=Paramecium sonneborni TaxID=65129 RepID=A0A8S1PV55_9CILI|nr:unnamed protein product [Paramecium sonneborni]